MEHSNPEQRRQKIQTELVQFTKLCMTQSPEQWAVFLQRDEPEYVKSFAQGCLSGVLDINNKFVHEPLEVTEQYIKEKAESLGAEKDCQGSLEQDGYACGCTYAFERLSRCIEPMQDRYEAVFGPNSKQLWLYDNINDTYIDPPKAVLEELDAIRFAGGTETSESLEAAEAKLEEIARGNPDWLHDGYEYIDIEI